VDLSQPVLCRLKFVQNSLANPVVRSEPPRSPPLAPSLPCQQHLVRSTGHTKMAHSRAMAA
jgi:hypothetical protein